MLEQSDLAAVRAAEREAVASLGRLEMALRNRGASYEPESKPRALYMDRANAVRDARAAIHAHQAERIKTRKAS